MARTASSPAHQRFYRLFVELAPNQALRPEFRLAKICSDVPEFARVQSQSNTRFCSLLMAHFGAKNAEVQHEKFQNSA